MLSPDSTVSYNFRYKQTFCLNFRPFKHKWRKMDNKTVSDHCELDPSGITSEVTAQVDCLARI